MKAEKINLYLSNANSVFDLVEKILANTDMVHSLEEALDFLRKVAEEYRVWIALKKELTFFPMRFHQEWKGKKIIWIIHYGNSNLTTSNERVGEEDKCIK